MSKKSLYHLVADNDTVDDDTILLAKRVGKRKIFYYVAFCAVVILLVLIGVGLALYFTVFKKNTNTTKSDCITPDVCNSKLLDYIDDNVDPCDDFYHYSCGSWLAANPLNDRDVRGMFYSLSLDNYDHLIGYLSQPVRQDDPTAIKKTKYIYSACKDTDYIEKKIAEHLQTFIKSKAGGWANIGIYPDNGWNINDALATDHYLGSSAFFGFGILPDDLNSSKPIIKVGKATTYYRCMTMQTAILVQLKPCTIKPQCGHANENDITTYM